MKKSTKTDPDMIDLINKMQEQLASLGQKMDILISKSSSQQADVRPQHPPYQQHQYRRDQQGSDNRNNFRDRVLHKAICAECRKECEVPFKPTGDRPVYCKDCFSKRKGGTSFNERPDNKPRQREWTHKEPDGDRYHGGNKKRPAPRKRSFPKKRKKF